MFAVQVRELREILISRKNRQGLLVSSLLRSSLLVSLLSIAACSGGNSDSQSQPVDTRIVNGQLTDQASLPSVKRLITLTPEGQPYSVCSGSFISPNHFLTAAHCVVLSEAGALPPSQLAVEISPGEFVISVGVAAYPSYQPELYAPSSEFPGLGYFPGDIAIVLVAEPYQGEIIPVSSRVPNVGMSTLIAGYGTTDAALPTDLLLRSGITTIDAVSSSDGVFYWVFDSLLESNTCYGDSGGPAIVQFAPEEPPVIVGVTSGGSQGCGLGTLSFDTTVSHQAYLDFIFAVTGGNFSIF